jgi:hypothetical protein
MSEAETFALLVAQRAIRDYHGTPFQSPARGGVSTLTGQLDRRCGFRWQLD